MLPFSKKCPTCRNVAIRTSKGPRVPHAGHVIKGYSRAHPLLGLVAAAVTAVTSLGFFDSYYCTTCHNTL